MPVGAMCGARLTDLPGGPFIKVVATSPASFRAIRENGHLHRGIDARGIFSSGGHEFTCQLTQNR